MPRKFIITAELRDLEQQVTEGKISYSRMVEILCEKADIYGEETLREKIAIKTMLKLLTTYPDWSWNVLNKNAINCADDLIQRLKTPPKKY
jgi:hypothetical protein